MQHILFAQTIQDYLKMGDLSFGNKNYVSSIYYYNRALGFDIDSLSAVFPYQPIRCTFPANTKDSSSAVTNPLELEIIAEQIIDSNIINLDSTVQDAIFTDSVVMRKKIVSQKPEVDYTPFDSTSLINIANPYADSINIRFQDIMNPQVPDHHKSLHTPNAESLSSKLDSLEAIASSQITPSEVGDEVNNYITSRYSYVTLRLAEAYRLSFNFPAAEMWYDNALKNKSQYSPITRFWYAGCLLRNAKYGKAMEEYAKFKEEYPEKESYYYQKAELEIKSCVFALVSMKKPKRGVSLSPIDSIVSNEGANFAATYFENDSSILFTSARTSSTFENKNDHQKGLFYCDLYKSDQSTGTWVPPQNIGFPINTAVHEGAAVLSSDKKKIYFTRWGTINDKEEYAIYVCNYFNGQWLQPFKLNENVNMPGFKSMQPAISPNGDILYFSSNRPGGQGKFDLWFCELDPAGNAGPAVNLGNKINTNEEDGAPYYHANSKTIYFSSDGRVGIGGIDIYRSFGEKETWSTVENLGYPVNSSGDDNYFVLSTNQRNGFLSSDRNSCLECTYGSCYFIYTITYLPLSLNISGTVYNKKTMEIIGNSLITLEDNLGNVEIIVTDENGKYATVLRENADYYLKCKKIRYFGDDAIVSTHDVEESISYIEDFFLERIPLGDIEIPGILYDYNKWDLRPESKLILNDLVKFLNVNDNIIIEIGSHTDERGNDDYNQSLSQKRAKSVIDYLIGNGIEKDRLTAIGYGETKLIVRNAQTEEDHQVNRRTAFKILSENYLPAGKKKKTKS